MLAVRSNYRVTCQAAQMLSFNPSFSELRTFLKTAVIELGCINQQRMLHTHAVIDALEAVAGRDPVFFISRVTDKLRAADFDGYDSSYRAGLREIFDFYDKLNSTEKEILELSAWAHDLGVPLGIEWEHAKHGAEVVRHIIRPESPYQKPVAELVVHHGEYSNMTSSSFPRDIYQLPQGLQRALLVLDFCDAAGRVNNQGEQSNPVGLKNLGYYVDFTLPGKLVQLEKAANLFDLRFQFGFGPTIFNRKMDEKIKEAVFAQVLRDIPMACRRDIMNFFGGSLRCHFLDVLCFAFEDQAVRAAILVALYNAYYSAKMNGEATLWPDRDIGLLLGKNFREFVESFKKFMADHEFKELLSPQPEKNTIIFLASKIWGSI